MDANQKSKLKMYVTVRDFLALFLTILNTLPNFPAFYAALQKVIKQIQQADTDQGTDKSGTTVSKKDLTNNLVTLAFDTCSKVFAYADFLKNAELKAKVNYSENDLKKMTTSTLCDTAQRIYDLAKANLVALEPYSVTAASQTALQAAIDALNAFAGRPRIVSGETSLATRQIADLLKEADATLKDLDILLEIIRLTQPDFYFKYKLARKTIQSSSSLSIMGFITDAASGLPLDGATVTFTLHGTSTTFRKKSAKKGGFRVSSAAEGTYTVSVALPGYKNKETTVSVVASHHSTLKVALEKA